MGASPAFQFYPGDWLSSDDIMEMSPAEEGAYIRLLAVAWGNDDCGLPDDDRRLAKLSRLGPAWAKSAETLRRCFRSKDGRLFNDRLLAERSKQAQWREKKSKAGKRGADSRWHRHDSAIGKSMAPPSEDDGKIMALRSPVSGLQSSTAGTGRPGGKATHIGDVLKQDIHTLTTVELVDICVGLDERERKADPVRCRAMWEGRVKELEELKCMHALDDALRKIHAEPSTFDNPAGYLNSETSKAVKRARKAARAAGGG